MLPLSSRLFKISHQTVRKSEVFPKFSFFLTVWCEILKSPERFTGEVEAPDFIKNTSWFGIYTVTKFLYFCLRCLFFRILVPLVDSVHEVFESGYTGVCYRSGNWVGFECWRVWRSVQNSALIRNLEVQVVLSVGELEDQYRTLPRYGTWKFRLW